MFQPIYLLVYDSVIIFTFAGLTHAAFARLLPLPLPLLIPWELEASYFALMIFPALAVWSDVRRSERVHPAWRLGIGTMAAAMLLTEVVTHSAIGSALYRVVTAGSPGAATAPLEYAPRLRALRHPTTLDEHQGAQILVSKQPQNRERLRMGGMQSFWHATILLLPTSCCTVCNAVLASATAPGAPSAIACIISTRNPSTPAGAAFGPRSRQATRSQAQSIMSSGVTICGNPNALRENVESRACPLFLLREPLYRTAV